MVKDKAAMWRKVISRLKQSEFIVSVDSINTDPDSYGCRGMLYKKGDTKYHNRFNFSVTNDDLIVGMRKETMEVVEAFSALAGFQPFCRYINKYGFITFHWSKNPRNCITMLQKDADMNNIQEFTVLKNK